MLIFGAVLVYVVVCIVLYFQTSHIVGYEVQEGSLSASYIYRGIAIRQEVVVTAQDAGYVNYFVREGERVSLGGLVYAVDETGRLKEYLENTVQDENALDPRELLEFRSEAISFVGSFTLKDFERVYEFKNTIRNTLLRLTSSNILESIQAAGEGQADDFLSYGTAVRSGIVAYWTDGYEDLTPEAVTADLFSEKDYEKKQLAIHELITAGEAAYKLSTDENWSLVIPVETQEGIRLEAEEYVKVRFLKNQYESWGAAKLFYNEDGNAYLQLSFTNSMLTFVSDRFLDVELLLDSETGLKIPNSSIAEREFYLVPEAFLTKSGENGDDGVIRQRYQEDGTVSTEFVKTEVYQFDQGTGEYYLDVGVLEPGAVLVQPDSQSTYTVSRKASLIGVYNMNKGYADFRQITILYQNEEYAIVQSNTRYGLNVYDYIVLDAQAVTDKQFL
jgi:hypothetical protein